MKFSELWNWKKPWIYVLIGVCVVGLVLGLCLGLLMPDKKGAKKPDGSDETPTLSPEQIEFFEGLEEFRPGASVMADSFDLPALDASENISEILYAGQDYVLAKVEKTTGIVVETSVEVFARSGKSLSRVLGGVSLIGDEFEFVERIGNTAVLAQTVGLVGGGEETTIGVLDLATKTLEVEFGIWQQYWVVGDFEVFVCATSGAFDSWKVVICKNGLQLFETETLFVDVADEKLAMLSENGFEVVLFENGVLNKTSLPVSEFLPDATSGNLQQIAESLADFYFMKKSANEFYVNLLVETSVQNANIVTLEDGQKQYFLNSNFVFDCGKKQFVKMQRQDCVFAYQIYDGLDVFSERVFVVEQDKVEYVKYFDKSGNLVFETDGKYGVMQFAIGENIVASDGFWAYLIDLKGTLVRELGEIARVRIVGDFVVCENGIFDFFGNKVFEQNYTIVSDVIGDKILLGRYDVFEDGGQLTKEFEWKIFDVETKELNDIENVADESEYVLTGIPFYVLKNATGKRLVYADKTVDVDSIEFEQVGETLFVKTVKDGRTSVQIFENARDVVLVLQTSVESDMKSDENLAAPLSLYKGYEEMLGRTFTVKDTKNGTTLSVSSSSTSQLLCNYETPGILIPNAIIYFKVKRPGNGAVYYDLTSDISAYYTIEKGATSGYLERTAGNQSLKWSDSNQKNLMTREIHSSYRDSVVKNPVITVKITPKTYKVTLKDRDTTYSSFNACNGQAYLLPASPKRTGYTFDGWCVNKNPVNYNSSDYIWSGNTIALSGDTTLYAQWIANTYIVTFNGNGGSVSTNEASKNVTYDSTYGRLPEPTRIGHTFAGWWTAKTGGTQITSTSKVSITANQTLYARWTANKYTVEFNGNGNGNDVSVSPNKQTVTFGSTYGELPTPTRAGYTFVGWWTKKTDGTKITSTSKVLITADQTLYAHWTVNTYTVTFDANGGSILTNEATRTVTFGSTYGELPEPTRTGYTFAGWWLGGAEIEDASTVATAKDHTLVAKWTANTYTVTFYGNGGSVSPNTTTVTYGSTYALPEDPTRTGYTFAGWWTASSGGTQITNESKVSIVADQTLYAHWVVVGDYYINGVMRAETHLGDYTYFLSGLNEQTWYQHFSVVVNDDIYTFKNQNNGTSQILDTTLDTIVLATIERQVVQVGDDYTVSYTVSLSSNAEVHLNYATIEFDAKGGADEEERLDWGAYDQLPEQTRTGYTFDGWWTAETDGTKITSGSEIEADAGGTTITLYARWTANTYTVEFNANGGSVSPNKQTVTYGSTYGTLPTPTRKGYTFAGWGTDASSETVITSTSTVSIAFNHTLYAHWTLIPFTITLNANGGKVDSLDVKTFDFADTNEFTVPGASREGYNSFVWKCGAVELPVGTYTDIRAWLSAKGFDIVEIVENDNSNIEFVAVWSGEVDYTISYEDEDTFESQGLITSYTISGKKLVEPTRTGYTFSEWVVFEGTATVSGNRIEAGSTGDVTLKAIWTANTYTVTFNGNGDDVSVSPNTKTVTYDSKYGTLPTPTRNGYTFAGWWTAETGGDKIEDNTTVGTSAEGQTLYAHWTANQYTVSFDANSGSAVESKTVTFDSAYGTLPRPTRKGYTFAGWWTASSGGEPITSTSTVSIVADQTLYAHWTVNTYTVTFDGNGNDVSVSPNTKTVTFDSAYGELPEPTRTGYTFDGWWLGGAEIEDASTVATAKDHTLVAKWTANTYTVTFNGNGDDVSVSPNTKTVTYDSKYGTLPTPTRPGHKFAGWWTESSGGTQIVSSTTVGTSAEGQTLYAHWEENTYTVTFNANGGSIETFDTNGDSILTNEETKIVTYGLTYGTLPTPIRTGYTFAGWWTAETGGTEITSTSTVSIDSDHTLYAHWTENQYVLKVWSAGSIVTEVTLKYTELFELDKHEFENGNFVLLGFAESQSGVEKYAVQGNESVSRLSADNGATVDLFAVWAFDIVFIAFEEGEDLVGTIDGSTAEQTVRINQPNYISANGFSSKFYDFEGWKIGDATLEETQLIDVSAIGGADVSGKVVAVAQWKTKTFVIDYQLVGNGGNTPTNPNPTTFDAEDKVIVLQDAELAGYEFLGFYTAYSDGARVVAVETGVASKDTTLYARFAKLYSVEIKYRDLATGQLVTRYLNADGSLSETEVFAFNENHKLDFVTRQYVAWIEGRDQSKYYGVTNGTKNWRLGGVVIAGETYNASAKIEDYVPDQDLEIVFVYTERALVTFDLDGKGVLDFGTVSGNMRLFEVDVNTSVAQEVERRNGEELEKLVDPISDEYTFGYWKLSDNTPMGHDYLISGDTLVRAHWRALVEFDIVDADGNVLASAESETVELESLVSGLAVLNKWNTSGTVVDNDFYFGKSKLFNLFAIGGKTYRMVGLADEDGGEVEKIEKNCKVLIELVERIEVVLKVSREGLEPDDDGQPDLFDYEEYLDSIRAGFEAENLEIGEIKIGLLDIEFVVVGDKNSQMPLILGPTKTTGTFVGWDLNSDDAPDWLKGEFELSGRTEMVAVYGETYQINLFYWNEDAGRYARHGLGIDLVDGLVIDISDFAGRGQIEIDGVELAPAMILVQEDGSTVEGLLQDLTAPGVVGAIEFEAGVLSNHINIYLVYTVAE